MGGSDKMCDVTRDVTRDVLMRNICRCDMGALGGKGEGQTVQKEHVIYGRPLTFNLQITFNLLDYI